MAQRVSRIVRSALARAPWSLSSVLALAGCVAAGGPADLDAPAPRPLPDDLRAHPSYQCLLESTEPTAPICDGRYEEGYRSGRTLLPTASVRTVAGDPGAMLRYHAPSASLEARWGGVAVMEEPASCGDGCAAATRVRFEDDAGVLDVAIAIDAATLDGVDLGTEVRVHLHEGLEVRRLADDALIFAVLEDRAPGFRDGERVPRRSFGPLAIEADATPVCNGFTTSPQWSCAKLYALDAIVVTGGETPVRIEPGETATVTTDEGIFAVRHRYGAHRIDVAESSACSPCSDREAAILSYEVARID